MIPLGESSRIEPTFGGVVIVIAPIPADLGFPRYVVDAVIWGGEGKPKKLQGLLQDGVLVVGFAILEGDGIVGLSEKLDLRHMLPDTPQTEISAVCGCGLW